MKYFTYKELSKSQTASNWGLTNYPGEAEKKNLTALVDNVLDPARELFGAPIMVNSGYRNPQINSLIGGASGSQHCKGQAVDIQTAGDKRNKELFEILKQFDFDQLIWEFGDDENPDWIHISYKSQEENRNQVLRSYKEGGKTRYIKLKK